MLYEVITNPLKAKQLEKGLTQLAEEGAVQLFRPLHNTDYILGAVGVLQFDVIMSRLKTEYGVITSYSIHYTKLYEVGHFSGPFMIDYVLLLEENMSSWMLKTSPLDLT